MLRGTLQNDKSRIDQVREATEAAALQINEARKLGLRWGEDAIQSMLGGFGLTEGCAALRSWLPKGTVSEKLLYRASVNGWAAAGFHRLCDGENNALVIAIDTEGSIFGGFTAHGFDSSNSYISDAQAFLFTLKNPSNSAPEKFGLVSAGYETQAVFCHATYGPTFGAGHDLLISGTGTITSNWRSYSNPRRIVLTNSGQLKDCFVFALK